MRSTTAAAVAALVLISACAPLIEGGPPIPLAPDLADGAFVGAVYVSTRWLQSEVDFTDTLVEEVTEELRGCATGGYPLELIMHIEDLQRADRLGVLLNGDGAHTMSGTVELRDPARGNLVVARYPIHVAAQAGGRIRGLVADRQMAVAEEFGREICVQAFGRNPRPRRPLNATPG